MLGRLQNEETHAATKVQEHTGSSRVEEIGRKRQTMKTASLLGELGKKAKAVKAKERKLKKKNSKTTRVSKRRMKLVTLVARVLYISINFVLDC